MKRYFVEIINTATEKNENFSGTIMRYIRGKNDRLMAKEAISDTKCYSKHLQLFNDLKNPVLVKEYGYVSERGAKSVITRFKKDIVPKEDWAWNIDYKVIEVEVE